MTAISFMDLNNHLELGPNCPSEEIKCSECPERKECSYATQDNG